MKKARNLATIGVAGFFLFIPYVMLLHFIGDPRIGDGSFTGEEMNLIEKGTLLGSTVLALVFWIYTIFKTFESRRFGWMIFSLWLWPLYPIYLWKFADET